MTISETDRLHSQLSRLEGMFPGYKTEIVEGNIMMSPLRPFHNQTIMRLWSELEPQLSQDWAIISDVSVPINAEFEFCPDLAVIPTPARDENRSAYSPDLVEFAVEVVSPSSTRNDYVVKDEWYARGGIPVYLIFDPYRAHCVTMWNPGPEGYLGRDTVPYGKTVSIDTPVGQLTFDTTRLPVDPKTPRP